MITGLAVAVAFPAVQCSGAPSGADYYRRIILEGETGVTPERLARLEQVALAKPSDPGVFHDLSIGFSKTTETMWAILYGEVYCSRAEDPARFFEISAAIGEAYKRSIRYEGGGSIAVKFTGERQAVIEIDDLGAGLEEQLVRGIEGLLRKFSLLYVTTIETDEYSGQQFSDPSIATLHQVRDRQVQLWESENHPPHAVLRWQIAMRKAGVFEAYNYWLLQKFKPREYRDWLRGNREALKAFLGWRRSNPIDLSQKNFYWLHH